MVGVASAQGKLRIGMETWVGYLAQLDSATKDGPDGGEAGFAVNRALAYINYYFNDEWSLHGGYDISEGADNQTALGRVDKALFHAYLQGKFHGHKFQVGRVNNWYVSHLDKALGTRWIAGSIAEESGAVRRNGDGLVFGGEVADMFHWDLSAVNGNRLTGANSNMDIAAHVGADFSEMFGLHLNVRSTTADRPEVGTLTWGAGLAFNHDMVDVLAEFYSSEDQNDGALDAVTVFGATANFKFMEGDVGLFAHYSTWENEAGSENSTHMTGGVVGSQGFDSFLKVGPWYNDSENGYKVGAFYGMATNSGAGEDLSMLEVKFASRF